MKTSSEARPRYERAMWFAVGAAVAVAQLLTVPACCADEKTAASATNSPPTVAPVAAVPNPSPNVSQTNALAQVGSIRDPIMDAPLLRVAPQTATLERAVRALPP